MAKVLMIHPDKCTGCRNCELACSFAHEAQLRPGACVKVCPTGAMHRSTETANLVDWAPRTCIRCKMCTVACPFGNARYDASSSSIFKCDTCKGAPECVAFCPNGALEFIDDEQQVRSRKKAYAARFKEAFQEVS